MITPRTEAKQQEIRQRILPFAAQMFLERGYTDTTVRDIATAADVNVSAMVRAVGSKEDILCELVDYVLTGQFSAAKAMLAGVTDDKLLYYAAETTLQLYMAEADEAVRELYSSAYSLSNTSELISQYVTKKLISVVFEDYLPDYNIDDFYQLEIASAGIIRGYMAVKCNEHFTIEQKVNRFLETALRIYKVPEEKIREAIEFVKQFDYPTIAQQTISDMLSSLAHTKYISTPDKSLLT